MSVISLTLNKSELAKICLELKAFEIKNLNAAIKHVFKLPEGRVTIYCTNAMVIQGTNPEIIYFKLYHKNYVESSANSINKTTTLKSSWNQKLMNSIGSDEVGVGDFFGGLVVAAAYVNINQIVWLKSIGVTDSKLLSDQQILEIFDQLKNTIKFSVVIASPCEYNQMFEKYQNAHIIKAVMHNQALTQLTNKIHEKYFIVMDQFAPEKNYLKYLSFAKQTVINVDLFLTKAESRYLCVACASIIARVFFLKQMDKLSHELNIKLPLGASNPCIPFVAQQIINKKKLVNLANYCKKHFVTYNKIVK